MLLFYHNFSNALLTYGLGEYLEWEAWSILALLKPSNSWIDLKALSFVLCLQDIKSSLHQMECSKFSKPSQVSIFPSKSTIPCTLWKSTFRHKGHFPLRLRFFSQVFGSVSFQEKQAERTPGSVWFQECLGNPYLLLSFLS